jgi:hypothetical protein
VELPRAVRTGRQEDEMSNSAFVAQNPFGLGIEDLCVSKTSPVLIW